MINSMPDISKHFFIMFYMIGFLLGIILLTLNQIYITKTQNICYKKLQLFNWAFLGHIVISFIYFYGLYFYISWGVRDYILFVVNSSYFLYIFFSIEMMQSFSSYRIPKGKALLIASGAFYVLAYSVTYKSVTNVTGHMTWNLPLVIFTLAGLVFVCVVLFCCIMLFVKWAGNRKTSEPALLIPVFSLGTIAYALFNSYVDICFCFFEDKTAVWGLNVYNLNVLYYIALNLLSIPLVYNRRLFFNKLLEKEHAINADKNAVLKVMTTTILDSGAKYHLSSRELEVLNLICQGKSNPDISCILFISNNTVKHHVNNIFKKMGVKSRYELLSILKNQYLI